MCLIKYVPLFEEWVSIGWEAWQDVYYDKLSEIESHELMRFSNWLKNGKMRSERQVWDLVSVDVIRPVWEHYVSTGHVRESHYGILTDAFDKTLYNAIVLRFNYDCYDMRIDSEMLDDYGLTRDQLDSEWVEYITNSETRQVRISDFGMRPVDEALSEAFRGDTPEVMIRSVDRIFQIVHMQSDLSAMFVEGGSKALSGLSEIQR